MPTDAGYTGINPKSEDKIMVSMERKCDSMKKILTALLLISLLVGGTLTLAGAEGLGSGFSVVSGEVTMIKSGIAGKKLYFSDGDFKSAFAVTDFDSITITRLPSSKDGTLLSAGRRISEGQTIKRKHIASMIFVPSSDSVAEASFSFILRGAGCGEETECRMRFSEVTNRAPETPTESAAALGVTTQSEISIFGRMEATDPEGDAMEFIVVAFPRKGSITVTDSAEGKYRYTPRADYLGYDSFTYVARDEWGNYSEPVTVDVRVIDRMSDEVFADMTDRSEYNAAVAMSAMGIMSGYTEGSLSYFNPEGAVSKAEFVAMAMKAYGIRQNSSYRMSFFDDNADIPAHLVCYVATAQKMGIIDGDFTKDGLIFNPNSAINLYEAAVIMSRIMGIGASGEEDELRENETVPSWARSDVYAMFTLGIFEGEWDTVNTEESVTRAAAAEYLYRMVKSKQ